MINCSGAPIPLFADTTDTDTFYLSIADYRYRYNNQKLFKILKLKKNEFLFKTATFLVSQHIVCNWKCYLQR